MDNNELIISIQTALDIPLNKNGDINKLRQSLAIYLNELIEKNFQQLVHVLYRMDVSEDKLKQMLRDNIREDAGMIIADLIIERQSQRIKARREFKKGDDPIAEEERW